MRSLFAVAPVLLGAAWLGAADPPPKADPPGLKVTGPDSVEVGKKCVLVAETKATKVTWRAPAGVDVLPLDGKRLAVWAPPGTYRLTALVPVGEDVVWVEHVLIVTGHGPQPPPVPPVPQPDGKLGLVKASRDGLAGVTDRTKARELAAAQRSHASAVAAGAYGDDAAQILAGWRDANKRAVDPVAWGPWGVAVSTRLADLYRDGKLKTRADWAAAFEEVAAGLEEGK